MVRTTNSWIGYILWREGIITQEILLNLGWTNSKATQISKIHFVWTKRLANFVDRVLKKKQPKTGHFRCRHLKSLYHQESFPIKKHSDNLLFLLNAKWWCWNIHNLFYFCYFGVFFLYHIVSFEVCKLQCWNFCVSITVFS